MMLKQLIKVLKVEIEFMSTYDIIALHKCQY